MRNVPKGVIAPAATVPDSPTARFARLSGVLLVAVGVLSLVWSLVEAVGRATGIGLLATYGLPLALTLGLVGGVAVGAAAAIGPAGLAARLTRLGLALVAVGALLGGVTELFSLTGNYNGPELWMETLPAVLVLGLRAIFFLGVLGGILGWSLTGLSLVRTAGTSRVAGLLLLAGGAMSVMLFGAAWLPYPDRQVWSTAIVVLNTGAGVFVNLGIVGIGMLALGRVTPDLRRRTGSLGGPST